MKQRGQQPLRVEVVEAKRRHESDDARMMTWGSHYDSLPMATKTPTPRRTRRPPAVGVCGLCGKPGPLARTECCHNLICDDEGAYLRNGCRTRHDRFTLCGFHASEAHAGAWSTCQKCRDEFETEIFVWYGTNQWNFVKLENPLSYRPTLCSTCGQRIRLGIDGLTILPDGRRLCERCVE